MIQWVGNLAIVCLDLSALGALEVMNGMVKEGRSRLTLVKIPFSLFSEELP